MRLASERREAKRQRMDEAAGAAVAEAALMVARSRARARTTTEEARSRARPRRSPLPDDASYHMLNKEVTVCAGRPLIGHWAATWLERALERSLACTK